MKSRIAKRVMSAVLASLMTGTLAVAVVPKQAGKAEAARSVQEVQKDKDAVESSISSTNSQLVSLLADVQDLNSQISSKQSEISDTQANLEAAQQSVEDQKKDIKLRMKYTYESGSDANMLSTILESKSISDFINRVEYVSTVYQYDNNQLDTYEATVKATESMKQELETEKQSLESKQTELSAKQQTLNNTLTTLQAQKGNIDAELTEAKAEAARKAEEERQAREAAQKKAAEEAARKATAAAAAQSQRSASTNAAAAGTSGSGRSSGGGNNRPQSYSGGGNPSGSVSGSAVVSYAMQFVGNPYVWGGISLTNGCDCSGFVMSVYQHFGKLPGAGHAYTSWSLENVGTAVSIDSIQPGDIVCYNAGGGHVAIYAGGGRIVEAQSTRAGITANRSVYCQKITAIRRL